MDIPQVTYVKDLISYSDKSLTLSREMEDGVENVKVSFPSLICVLQNDFEPRRPMINGIITASKKQIKVCSMEDIGLTPDRVGLKGSPTYVSKAFRNVTAHNAQKFKLNVEDSVDLLKQRLEQLSAK